MGNQEIKQWVMGRGQQQFSIRQLNDFYEDVSNGNVPGWRRLGFGGNNPIAIQDVEETIWAIGGIRTTPDTIPFDAYISSSDPTDNAPILILGLDDNGKLTFRLAILDGQNQVLIGGGKMLRLFLHEAGEGNANGTIYIAKQDAAIGGIPAHIKILSASLPNMRLSWNGFISVPAGSTMKLIDVFLTPIKDKATEVFFKSKYGYETNWTYAAPFETGQNFRFTPSPFIDESVDIEFSVIGRDTGVKATVYADTMIIDNNYL